MELPENPVRPVTQRDKKYLHFLVDAMEQVESWEPRVRSMIAHKSLPAGKWHPNGFAVFHLESIEGLGNLRLHFWPKNLRSPLKGHPQVHKHSFHLYSKILEAGYRDAEFDVQDLAEDLPPPSQGTLDNSLPRSVGRKYAIDYAYEGEGDRIFDTEQWASITTRNPRVDYGAGQWHEMVSGDFHSTPIPRSVFCSTLMMMSFRDQGQDVLVGNPKFGTTVHRRPEVAREDMETMCQQFIDEAEERTGSVLYTTDVRTGRFVKGPSGSTPEPLQSWQPQQPSQSPQQPPK